MPSPGADWPAIVMNDLSITSGDFKLDRAGDIKHDRARPGRRADALAQRSWAVVGQRRDMVDVAAATAARKAAKALGAGKGELPFFSRVFGSHVRLSGKRREEQRCNECCMIKTMVHGTAQSEVNRVGDLCRH